jgi:hypothetical protein
VRFSAPVNLAASAVSVLALFFVVFVLVQEIKKQFLGASPGLFSLTGRGSFGFLFV